MIPKLSTFALLFAVSGCCLDDTISSGTGDTAQSTSAGGIGASSGTTTRGATNGPPPTGTGTGVGTGSGSGDGAGTTTGTGTTGTLTVSQDPIDFGNVPLLTPTIACTTVSNTFRTAITLTGVGSFQTEGGSFEVSTTNGAHPPGPFSFPITIDGGGSAQVCFSFTCPITQDFNGQATLLTDDPNVTDPVVQLTGWCGGPQITCTPLTLAFGSVAIGQASTLPVTCSNTGTAIPGVNLTIGPITTTGAAFSAAFDPTTNPYPNGGLEPGQSAQIDVTYAPTGDTTDFGVVEISNNGAQGETPYVSLSGS